MKHLRSFGVAVIVMIFATGSLIPSAFADEETPSSDSTSKVEDKKETTHDDDAAEEAAKAKAKAVERASDEAKAKKAAELAAAQQEAADKAAEAAAEQKAAEKAAQKAAAKKAKAEAAKAEAKQEAAAEEANDESQDSSEASEDETAQTETSAPETTAPSKKPTATPEATADAVVPTSSVQPTQQATADAKAAAPTTQATKAAATSATTAPPTSWVCQPGDTRRVIDSVSSPIHEGNTVEIPDINGTDYAYNYAPETVVEIVGTITVSAKPVDGACFKPGIQTSWTYTAGGPTTEPPVLIKIVIEPKPSATVPTCASDGKLSLSPIDHVTWTGGKNGDGPGTYNLSASADKGRVIDGPSTFTVVVKPKLTGDECEPPPVTPEGKLKVVTSDCEAISADVSGVKPEGATVVLKDNGVAQGVWSYQATPGTHTIEVFVNGQKVDSKTVTVKDCPKPPTKIDLPAQPGVDDKCGPTNAVWNVPGDTNTLDWKVSDGHLIVTIVKGNTQFMDGTTTHDYGLAPDSGELCPTPPSKYPYEVSAWWQMVKPDLTKPNSLEYPQVRISGEPTPACEPVKVQHDTYWIRDGADETYFASLVELTSQADDAQLEPHGYGVKIVVDKSLCEPTPPSVTQVVAGAHKIDKCGKANDKVKTKSVKGVSYNIDGKPSQGTVTVTASAKAGYELEGKSTWTFTFSSKKCQSTPPANHQTTVDNSKSDDDRPSFNTGMDGSSNTPWGFGAALVLALVGGLLLRRRPA